MGIAVVAVDELADDIVQRASDARYAAKRAGGDRYQVAGPLDTSEAQQRMELEAALRRAMDSAHHEVQLVFQPIVDRAGRPVAAEALLRWNHPRRGPLMPADFLELAESAGLMPELGQFVLEKSVLAAAEWAAAGHPLQVAVNIAARQLGSGALERLVRRLLDDTAMSPELLCLEVTESVLVNADSPELAELHRLRALGCKIALDDFGTGYSPLTYLKRLPATTLKLDRSFVEGLNHPEPDSIGLAIARSVLRLGVETGLSVIAEGVESQRQFEVLVGLGYELFQGYWAHFPMPSSELATLLGRSAAAGG